MPIKQPLCIFPEVLFPSDLGFIEVESMGRGLLEPTMSSEKRENWLLETGLQGRSHHVSLLFETLLESFMIWGSRNTVH